MLARICRWKLLAENSVKFVGIEIVSIDVQNLSGRQDIMSVRLNIG